MSWSVQVEPPEDMDETSYDIDPRMKIWKSMKGAEQGRQHLEPEEDLDELFHPSLADLRIQMENQDVPSAVQAVQEVASVKYSQEPEDRDDIDHPDVFEEVKAAPEPVKMAALEAQVRGQGEPRVHVEPEEDMDDLYHKDVQPFIVYQSEGEADAPAEVPPQRMYDEPEGDLDYLYHP